MNTTEVGALFRAVRIRRGLSQAEVGAAAQLAQSTVSLAERGRFELLSFASLERIARVLGVTLSMDARWRGVEGARLLDARHAVLVRVALERLRAAGWEAWPEKTFSFWGERGSLDILAWHAATRTAVSLEVKTRVVDLQELLSTMDRRHRLLPAIGRAAGVEPRHVASLLVLPEETWARNCLRRFAATFDAALPARTIEVRRWLAEPAGGLKGVWILPCSDTIVGPRGRSGETRVSPPRPRVRPA